MTGVLKIRRALISVSDKSDLISLATCLQNYNVEIVSTGGTGRKLSEAGIDFIDIQKITGNPEAFGGRMKTISFQVESALLFDREKDAAEAKSLNITPIDLVVCNLYPFEKVLKEGADLETLIENIDIGGPTMVRSAAKNFKYVGVATDPSDYPALITELEAHSGALSLGTRKQLMRKAFNHTADYDSMIAVAMDKEEGIDSQRLSFSNGISLRYGENSHQSAKWYREMSADHSLFDLEVLHGKALSFNNILDINGAIDAVRSLDNHACSVIKHSNPCGLAVGKDQAAALKLAWEGDPISAFGSIIAFNSELQFDTAEFLKLDAENRAERKFVEVIIAPSFNEDALAYLQQHKNLRIIAFDTTKASQSLDLRYFDGSLLVQDQDNHLYDKMEMATSGEGDIDKGLVEFGLKAISNIKSNSIALVRRKDDYLQLLGMGAGQPNRLVATRLALTKASENLKNEVSDLESSEVYIREEIGKSMMISDAFFPFADNVELASTFGVRSIVQPGGSIRDKEVIAKCEELEICMIMTGTRHFKH